MLNKIQWLGTATSIIGAFIVAFGAMLAGYSFFMVGSISWLIVGFKQQNKPLIVLNGTFFLANVLGFARSVI